MRLSRRTVLGGLAAAAASPALAQAPEQPLIALSIASRPIQHFEARSPDKTRFGQLVFRGGLVMSGSHPRFGGLSGLWRPADGGALVAVTDNGFWLTARPRYEGERIAGLEDAQLAPILGSSGRPLHRSRYYDTESLAMAEGVAYLGVERTHDVLRFEWARDGVGARARPVPLPRELKSLPNNRGIEALGVLPRGHRLAGALLAISERSGPDDSPTLGAIIGGREAGLLQVRRHDGFDITDLAFLPDGDLLLLERWFKPFRGVGLRIRRVPGHSIQKGAILDGSYLIEADLGQEIDNMEGISIHRSQGRTVITLVSDNNFSFLQRNLLLEFELG
jgi:hypothetical protein